MVGRQAWFGGGRICYRSGNHLAWKKNLRKIVNGSILDHSIEEKHRFAPRECQIQRKVKKKKSDEPLPRFEVPTKDPYIPFFQEKHNGEKGRKQSVI